jgi:hypothetical protein
LLQVMLVRNLRTSNERGFLMRKLRHLALTLALLGSTWLGGGVTPMVANAAPQAPQDIRLNLTGNFTATTGGAVNGSTALLAGKMDSAAGTMSRLTGTLNLGVRDYNFQVDPKGSISVSSNSFPIFWDPCNFPPFPSCSPTPQIGTVTFSTSSVPVDLHFGGSHGTGNLFWSTSSCVNCPPPPFGPPPSQPPFVQLNGGVTGAQTAGMMNYAGPLTIS